MPSGLMPIAIGYSRPPEILWICSGTIEAVLSILCQLLPMARVLHFGATLGFSIWFDPKSGVCSSLQTVNV